MSTPVLDAEQVAETYRRDLLSLRAVLLYEITRAWVALNPADVVGSAARWMAQMIEIVTDAQQRALPRAQEYYREYRRAVIGLALDDEFFAELMPQPNIDRIRTSLGVTGPTALLRNLRQDMPPDLAKDRALVTVSGSATRLALAPARDMLIEASRADEQAVGWARLTDAKPCYFCALLASRGPVYHTRETADFRAHDHCACTVVPMFSRSAPWPGRAREWQRLYNATTGGVSGKEKLRAFRRAYTARQRALS